MHNLIFLYDAVADWGLGWLLIMGFTLMIYLVFESVFKDDITRSRKEKENKKKEKIRGIEKYYKMK